MAEKLYIPDGFRAARYAMYVSLGSITAGLQREFGGIPGVDIRQTIRSDDNETDTDEPYIKIIGTPEIRKKSWPKGIELGALFDGIEHYAPDILDPCRVRMVDVNCNADREGMTYVNVEPSQADLRTLSASRSAIIEEIERFTGRNFDWRRANMDMTLACIDYETPLRVADEIEQYIADLLPLDIDFGGIEFTPDPRFQEY